MQKQNTFCIWCGLTRRTLQISGTTRLIVRVTRSLVSCSSFVNFSKLIVTTVVGNLICWCINTSSLIAQKQIKSKYEQGYLTIMKDYILRIESHNLPSSGISEYTSQSSVGHSILWWFALQMSLLYYIQSTNGTKKIFNLEIRTPLAEW